MPDRAKLIAPAKVNLYLAVGERGADGYHALTTVFQALDERLSDFVEVRRAPSFSVSMIPDLGIPPRDNLALRGAVMLAEEVGAASGLEITIEKRIPAGGGLGGASSDAAATLLGACVLWGLDPASDVVRRCARSLGADVPFFLDGGTGLYAGRGDVRVKTLPTPQLEFVVLSAGEPVSTSAAYAFFDRSLRAMAPGPGRILEAIASGDAAAIAGALHNDLAPAARALAAGVAEAEAWLSRQEGALGAAVTGSGSCVFAICSSGAAAARIAEAAADAGWWAQVCSTSAEGVRTSSVD